MRKSLKLLATLTLTMAPISATAQDADWTGFYAGFGVGYSTASDAALDDSTTSYGVHAGYDYDFGQFVLGGEVQYSAADYTINAVDIDTETLRLKLRGGYDLGKTLVYGVAGYSDVDAKSAGISANDESLSIGFGGAYKVLNNVELGLEYLHEAGDTVIDSLNARISYRF